MIELLSEFSFILYASVFHAITPQWNSTTRNEIPALAHKRLLARSDAAQDTHSSSILHKPSVIINTHTTPVHIKRSCLLVLLVRPPINDRHTPARQWPLGVMVKIVLHLSATFAAKQAGCHKAACPMNLIVATGADGITQDTNNWASTQKQATSPQLQQNPFSACINNYAEVR